MQRASSLVRKLKLPAGSDSPENRAKAAWKLAAGPKIEKYTLAAGLVRNTLVVEVGDIVWQKQLHTLRGFLVARMTEILGEAIVTELDFRPMPPRMRPQRAEATRAADAISDPFLSLLYEQSKKKQA